MSIIPQTFILARSQGKKNGEVEAMKMERNLNTIICPLLYIVFLLEGGFLLILVVDILNPFGRRHPIDTPATHGTEW